MGLLSAIKEPEKNLESGAGSNLVVRLPELTLFPAQVLSNHIRICNSLCFHFVFLSTIFIYLFVLIMLGLHGCAQAFFSSLHSLVAASGGYSSLQCMSFSLQ